MLTVTAQTITDEHDLLVTPPTPTPLRIPRPTQRTFLGVLQTVMMAWTRRRPMESRGIRPDGPRWETPIDRCIRIDPYLYLRSLSG